MSLAFYKVTALPEVLAANALYFVSAANGQLMEVYMANSAGTAARKVIGEAEVSAALAAYDAAGASKLAEAFTLATSGAATGSVEVDGSGNVELVLTLADSGAVAGEFPVVTVNAKGIVTGGRALARTDLPSEIDADTTGNAATATRADSAASADQTQAALTINGEAFNGSEAKSFSLVTAAEKGAAGGVATLDEAGKVPAAQLPSYVDDVQEANDFASLPATGERDKIYVTIDNGNVYRWTGSVYIRINDAVTTADVADTLAVSRQIGVSGDATGSAAFNGSADAVFEVTLKNVGTAGEQAPVVTTDAAGRVVSSRALELSDLPAGITATGVALAEPAAW